MIYDSMKRVLFIFSIPSHSTFIIISISRVQVQEQNLCIIYNFAQPRMEIKSSSKVVKL